MDTFEMTLCLRASIQPSPKMAQEWHHSAPFQSALAKLSKQRHELGDPALVQTSVRANTKLGKVGSATKVT